MSEAFREHEFEIDPDPTVSSASTDLLKPLEPQRSGPLGELNDEQRARVAALNLAAPVLSDKPMLGGSKAPDVFDLLRVSQWILTGTDLLDDANQKYPIETGDVIILGPEVFVDRDGTTISWAGQNYELNNDDLKGEIETDD